MKYICHCLFEQIYIKILKKNLKTGHTFHEQISQLQSQLFFSAAINVCRIVRDRNQSVIAENSDFRSATTGLLNFHVIDTLVHQFLNEEIDINLSPFVFCFPENLLLRRCALPLMSWLISQWLIECLQLKNFFYLCNFFLLAQNDEFIP